MLSSIHGGGKQRPVLNVDILNAIYNNLVDTAGEMNPFNENKQETLPNFNRQNENLIKLQK